MDAKKELRSYKDIIMKLRDVMLKLKKYKGNTTYKKHLAQNIDELNRYHIFFKTKILKTKKKTLIEKFNTVDEIVNFLIKDNQIDEKLNKITELERFWPELEIEFEQLKFNIQSFEIPEEIPMMEYRLDLEEAIKDFDNGCFVSALVLCRRAYEGALVSLYKKNTGHDPVEDIRCKNCKNIIKEKSYIGIANLHKWAIDNHLITEKLKQVGFLLTDMGAGAAHPPLIEFPRNEEMARLGITATLALLKELHISNQE